MTEKKRVASLYERMEKLQHVREQRRTAVLGTACTILAMCLAILIAGQDMRTSPDTGIYSGSAMIFDSAGPYVLTAVIAFMLGVVITVIIRRQQAKKKQENDADSDD